MARHGTRLVVLSLILGVTIGLGVKAVQRYIALELMGVLEDEMRASCPCDLAWDSVRLSFIPLAATAENARMISGGKVALRARRLEADFSLAKIRERKLLLSELRLIDGEVHGVGAESPTFRFIDHLAAPIPPERDRPDRWKLKLQRLVLTNGEFTEPLGERTLEGSGVSLELQRTPSDDFTLIPRAERLALLADGEEQMRFGRLEGELFLEDLYVDLRRITLALERNVANLSATVWTKERNLLEGGLDFHVELDDTLLAPFSAGTLEGRATLAGRFAEPIAEGTLTLPRSSALTIETRVGPDVQLDALSSTWRFALEEGGEVEAGLQSLSARGPDTSIEVRSPFRLHRGELAGSALVRIGELELAGALARNVEVEFSLDGSIEAPRPSLSGRIGALAAGGVTLPDLQFKAAPTAGGIAVSVERPRDAAGALRVTAVIDPASDSIRDGTFEISDLSLDKESTSPPRLSLSGSLRGPLALTGLTGDGVVSLASPTLPEPMTGRITIANGSLTGALSDRAGVASIEVKLDAAGSTGSARATVRNLTPVRDDECTTLSLDATYDFKLAAPETGSGSIVIPTAQLGCAPWQLRVTEARLPVRGGTVEIPGVTLSGPETSVLVSGSVSPAGANVTAAGALHLNSLLSLVPSFDDLRGILDIDLAVSGPLKNLALVGEGRLREGGMEIESIDLSAENVSGLLHLTGQQIALEQMSGELNDGTFRLEGTLFPFAVDRSSLAASFDRVALQPVENTLLVLSGDLALRQPQQPAITGLVRIEEGEFQRNVSLASVIRAIAEAVLTRAELRAATRELPAIKLDIQVEAGRNLFVATNWASAELRAALNIGGTLSTPAVAGRVEALSGWFGLKNRQFELTSGALTFRPGAVDPSLEVVGETRVISRAGDEVLVILEATGPTSGPRIRLSSDRGLTEGEILALLTQGGAPLTQSRLELAGAGRDTAGLSLLDRYSLLGFGQTLSALTRIDQLSLEPAFNPQTGLIEPAIVAQKRVTDRISLIGETLFGGIARLKALYRLGARLSLSGIAENDPARTQTTFGSDLTWTILASQHEFLRITVTGNDVVDEFDLRRGIRLNPQSRIAATEIGRVRQDAERYYRSQGFFQPEITARCDEFREPFCRALTLAVSEGPRAVVTAITLTGESVDGVIPARQLARLTDSAGTVAATDTFARERREAMTAALRSEGYVGARVQSRYRESVADASAGMELVLEIHLGRPISFTFEGNTAFSPADFLATINLFKRRQPFGTNTIRILLENIERKYREAGYLYVTLIPEERTDEQGRTTWHIQIDEGQRVPVAGALLVGNTRLSFDQIESRLTQEGLSPDRIFQPAAALAEELEANSDAIRAVYIDEGFPEARVTPRIVPLENGTRVQIEYEVVEGPLVQAHQLAVAGLPDGFTRPRKAGREWSIPRANRYITELVDALRDEGWLAPAISSRLDPDSGILTLEVVPGLQTRIGQILFEGNLNIETTLLERNVTVTADAPWRAADLSETRRRLLRLGLFARVELAPRDGTLNDPVEDLLISVEEQPMQTLELGTGVNSEYGLHLFGEATDRLLFRDGRSLSLRLDTYYDQAAADISQGFANLRYSHPSFLDSPYLLTEDARFQRLEQSSQEFDLDRVSLASYLYRSFDSGLALAAGHTILEENLDNVAPDVILSDLDEGSVALSFFSGTLTWDGRDNPLNPAAGPAGTLDWKLATEALASDANFLQLGGRVSYLHPLPLRRFSLAGGARLEWAEPFGNTEEIPISQRFYLGGRTTVRGFRENSLGPRGSEGGVIGGDTLVSSNLELRYLFADSFSFHTFLDAGTVYLRDRSMSIDDLRYSTGFGLRYLSAIGPIGFDIGHPLDERPGEPSLRFHFSIGTPF